MSKFKKFADFYERRKKLVILLQTSFTSVKRSLAAPFARPKDNIVSIDQVIS